VRTEQELGKLMLNEDDENQEKSLRWLLEMDYSEPEEKVFTVLGNDYQDSGLSAFEAEFAGRPLVRGNAQGDDLASYIAEEIVYTADSAAGDIYGKKEQQVVDARADEARDEFMAIDFSRGRQDHEPTVAARIDEGADILGLSGDDDIGEKFVSIVRVKPTVAAGSTVLLDSSASPAAGMAGEESAAADISVAGVVQGADASSIEAGDVSSSDAVVTGEFDHTAEIILTGAPVPTLVADPANVHVANDSGIGDALQHGSVADYVANLPQALDDEAFDNFLLAGGHLLDSGADPEDLVVARTEGVVAVDPAVDVTIDYHEDFRAMDGFARDSASAVASVITPVMEEISAAVQARLAGLGLGADTIAVDVRLGTDEVSIKQCYAQGFEPVHAICFELPAPLRSIDSAARDSIYVRLLNVQTEENWNDLFSTDFSVVRTQPASAAALLPGAVQPQEALTDWTLDEGFGEDIFGENFADDFDDQFAGADALHNADIEAAFANLATAADEVDDFGAASYEVIGSAASSADSFVADGPVADDPVADGPVVDDPVADGPVVAASTAEVMVAHSNDADDFIDEQPAVVAETPVEQPLAAVAEQDIVELVNPAQEDDIAAFDGTRVGGFIPDYITFNFTTQSNAEIFTDFLDAFIEEGTTEVERLEHEVGEWEKHVSSEPLFAKVGRTLHTIKGIAKGVGLQRLGTLVHNFETLLEKMPRPNAGEEQMYFRIVNAWLDAVVRGVEHVTEQRIDVASELPVQGIEADAEQAPAAANLSVLDAIEIRASKPIPKKSEGRPVQQPAQAAAVSALEKKRDQQLADEGAKVLAAQQSVRITSEKLDHLLNLTSQVQQLGVRASQNTSRSKRSSAELQARLSSVRTHIRKIADRALLNVNARPGSSTPDLDALEMDQYSELQEAANILREGVEDLADLVDTLSRQNTQIETLLKQQSSVISSISSSIQSARVVPVSRLMPGLRRIVRTVSTDLGKIVAFKVLNETGALDRDHYARLQVAMEHMVRNALDHGIESPDERVAVGKPTGGRITIDVRKSGGDYVIRLSDDGRGIDPDTIRASAYKKGLDVDIDALSDEEVMRLIFHKGFSTASTLSEISGRGVGMDIVLTELQQIGGSITIQSTVGLGTVFEVRIPSNVSVNGALLVAAAGESYAIPLNGLIAVDQIPVDDFFAAVEQRGTLTIGGLACEPTYLATLCQGLGLPDRSAWGKFVPVIIAGHGDRHMAIAIDNLEEALELVVRSLGSQFSAVPGVAGAATTAEGAAIVALDLNVLVSHAGADGLAPVAVRQAKSATLLALVVDDSRTQRMVATNQLESVGAETVTAENGLVAIDLLNSTHRLPDIILLDVEMPVKDGIQTLREIRKSQRYGHLPVIMVTSRTGVKHRALASEAGCNAYMGKPFNFPALIRQINELTGHELHVS
jgi:chemotaxis protein histidine kinase CheA